MKKLNLRLALPALLLALFFVGCLKDQETLIDQDENLSAQQNALAPTDEDADIDVVSYSGQAIPGQYIVVYKEEGLTTGRSMADRPYSERQRIMREETATTLRRHAIPTEKISQVYGTALKGFALKNVTEAEMASLRRDPQVKYVEQDQIVTVSMGGPPGGGGGGGGGQSTPWGVTRVGGAQDGSGMTAWIIDSGIDLDHPDLIVDESRSQTFLGGNSTPDDQNGHGTHVAGTVAAINNSEGVVGVAAGATVVAVRVLDRRGSGSYSGVIAGVDYVAANASQGDAANMSLGGPPSQALDDAVSNASGSCAFVLAAGNESTNAGTRSPARVNGNNIYTVSAMDINNNWAYFSNYGNPPVDYCAPGVSIESCWKGGGYNTISGTSMAAPHVCGIVLIGGITTDGNVNGDPDGNADPIAHH